MLPLEDTELRALLDSDPVGGWRAFIDQYTPLILGLIRRAGVSHRDEMMEIYVQICESLSASGFRRLKRQDSSRGSLGGWLAVITRHAVVDWVRSRKGRRRLFQAVRGLPAFDRRVFELYYWEDRSPSEIAELLAQHSKAAPDLAVVFEALDRVQACLSDRHRAELLATAARFKAPLALDDTDVTERAVDPRHDPDTALRVKTLNARLESALARLPAEDAAIVRLKYLEGLSNGEVAHALGLGALAVSRLREILARIRVELTELGVQADDIPLARQVSLEGE